MKPFHLFRRILLVLALGWVAFAHAGGSADSRFGVEKYGDAAIRDLALRLNDDLDARKVNLAIVARAGRPRSQLPRGISYTHVAFIVFEPVVGADGQPFYTYATYNLYQGGTGQETTSYLRQDLTYDFVAGVLEPDVAVCVPTPELQRRIVHVIRSPLYRALHTSEYNLVANPWVDRYDNCATHLLKVIVAGIYETDNRQRIYENIRTYFAPTRIRLNLIESIGSNFVPAVRREDEDPSGLQTASYDSIVRFLQQYGLVADTFCVRIEPLPTRHQP